MTNRRPFPAWTPFVLLATWLLATIAAAVPARAQAFEPVHLELVLAVDTSTSVDASEFDIQRRGLSAAFRDAAVLSAIEALGAPGIAVSLVQWSSRSQQVTAVDWHRIYDQASAAVFANNVDAMTRRFFGFTNLSGALNHSRREIETNRFEGIRKVIDVSGDGTSSWSNPSPARDAAIAVGITINALIIHADEYDLGDLADAELREFYLDHVVGGDGAFLLEATSYTDFPRAIRQKLMREILGEIFAALPTDPHP